METPGTRQPEDAHPRYTPTRPAAQNGKNSQGLIDAGVQPPSESPDSGGVVASSQTESGSTRGATEDRQTKDHNGIADVIRRLTHKAGLVGETRLAIEVDEETNESRFLILSKSTGEVLRAIPSEDILPLLRDAFNQHGAIVNRRV